MKSALATLSAKLPRLKASTKIRIVPGQGTSAAASAISHSRPFSPPPVAPFCSERDEVCFLKFAEFKACFCPFWLDEFSSRLAVKFESKFSSAAAALKFLVSKYCADSPL